MRAERKDRMDDKDVKRPYLERNHEAKGPHVPKGLMGLIILLMGLMGCSGEEAAELVQPDTGTAIAFAAEQQKEQAVTRADKPLKDYVQTFKVYGFKNMSGDNTNGYSDLQQVFPGYTVNWKATSTSSSSGWEYLNQQPLGQTVQTIKYWDWSAKAYRFFAVAGAEGTNEVTGAYKTYPTYEAYEVTYEADANSDSKIPYYSHLWFSNNNYETYPDRQFGKPVQLVFVKPLSKVRFLFTFEDPSEAEAELTNKEFTPTNGNTIKQKGDVTVIYPLTGTDLREGFSTSSNDEGIPAFKEDETLYTVLPAKNQGTYTLKVSVNGDPKSCVVPAIFMEWLPGYTYTYIFKVHVDGSVDIDAVQSAFTQWEYYYADHTVYNW